MIFSPNKFEFVATRAWIVSRTVFMELTMIKGLGSDELLSDWVKRVDHLHAKRLFHGASVFGKKFFDTVVGRHRNNQCVPNLVLVCGGQFLCMLICRFRCRQNPGRFRPSACRLHGQPGWHGFFAQNHGQIFTQHLPRQAGHWAGKKMTEQCMCCLLLGQWGIWRGGIHQNMGIHRPKNFTLHKHRCVQRLCRRAQSFEKTKL